MGRPIPKKTKQAIKRVAKRRLPVHHRWIIHPITIFFILCLGVFLINWTVRAFSDSYVVNAEVPAPPLSSGAYITSPINGASFTTTPIDVSGTCPANSYVKLFNNALLVGVAWCQSDLFTIQTGLYLGQNTLQAQDYNITNDPGPATPTVKVTYSATTSTLPKSQVLILASQAGIKPVAKVATGLPLVLSTNYSFKTFAVGILFSWPIQIEGGTQPYILQIDWGEGSTSIISPNTTPNFTITHVYSKIGYYPIRIRAVDIAGHQAYLQLAGLIRLANQIGFNSVCALSASPATPGVVSACTPPASNFVGFMKNWLWLIWTSYAAILLMAISYWLGERQEYLKLTKRYPTLLS